MLPNDRFHQIRALYNSLSDERYKSRTAKIKRLLRDGYSAYQVSKALNISRRTVQNIQTDRLSKINKETKFALEKYLDECKNSRIKSGKKISNTFIHTCTERFFLLRRKKYREVSKDVSDRLKLHRQKREMQKMIYNELDIEFKPESELSFGYKDESYWKSEEQMILGYIAPEFNDLSFSEQEIWVSMENE